MSILIIRYELISDVQVFQPVNAEIESEALKTTQVLIQTLYDESVDVPEDLNSVRGLAKDICEECQELMAEPEKSQAVPATKMIASLLGTTRKSGYICALSH